MLLSRKGVGKNGRSTAFCSTASSSTGLPGSASGSAEQAPRPASARAPELDSAAAPAAAAELAVVAAQPAELLGSAPASPDQLLSSMRSALARHTIEVR